MGTSESCGSSTIVPPVEDCHCKKPLKSDSSLLHGDARMARKNQRRSGEQVSPETIGSRTTVMLRNLPNHYTADLVLAMLDAEGFAGLFDFLYLPIDLKSHACLGYAFINLVHPSHV